eukprot:690780-Pyramimonas_sp.AAC.1
MVVFRRLLVLRLSDSLPSSFQGRDDCVLRFPCWSCQGKGWASRRPDPCHRSAWRCTRIHAAPDEANEDEG